MRSKQIKGVLILVLVFTILSSTELVKSAMTAQIANPDKIKGLEQTGFTFKVTNVDKPQGIGQIKIDGANNFEGLLCPQNLAGSLYAWARVVDDGTFCTYMSTLGLLGQGQTETLNGISATPLREGDDLTFSISGWIFGDGFDGPINTNAILIDNTPPTATVSVVDGPENGYYIDDFDAQVNFEDANELQCYYCTEAECDNPVDNWHTIPGCSNNPITITVGEGKDCSDSGQGSCIVKVAAIDTVGWETIAGAAASIEQKPTATVTIPEGWKAAPFDAQISFTDNGNIASCSYYYKNGEDDWSVEIPIADCSAATQQITVGLNGQCRAQGPQACGVKVKAIDDQGLETESEPAYANIDWDTPVVNTEDQSDPNVWQSEDLFIDPSIYEDNNWEQVIDRCNLYVNGDKKEDFTGYNACINRMTITVGPDGYCSQEGQDKCTIDLEVFDKFGHSSKLSEDEGSPVYDIDFSEPITSVTNVPTGWQTTDFQVTLNYEDTNTLSECKYYVNDVENIVDCAEAPKSVTVTVGDGKECSTQGVGQCTIYTKVKDIAEKEVTGSPVSLDIDYEAPAATVSTSEQYIVNSNEVNLGLACDVGSGSEIPTDDGNVNPRGIRLYWHREGTAWAELADSKFDYDCAAGTLIADMSTIVNPDGTKIEGVYYFYAKAEDAAGNIESVTGDSEAQAIIDETAPTIGETYTVDPIVNSGQIQWINANQATLNIEVLDGTSGIDNCHTELALDLNDPNSVTQWDLSLSEGDEYSGIWSGILDLSGISDGQSYTLEVICQDKAEVEEAIENPDFPLNSRFTYGEDNSVGIDRLTANEPKADLSNSFNNDKYFNVAELIDEGGIKKEQFGLTCAEGVSGIAADVDTNDDNAGISLYVCDAASDCSNPDSWIYLEDSSFDYDCTAGTLKMNYDVTSEGSFYFFTIARDQAGNIEDYGSQESEVVALGDIVIDTGLPQISDEFNINPAVDYEGKAWTNGESISISSGASDGVSGVANCVLGLVSGEQQVERIEGLTELEDNVWGKEGISFAADSGTYTLVMRCTDWAGNAYQTTYLDAGNNFAIDKIAPTITNEQPTGTYYGNNGNAILSAKVCDNLKLSDEGSLIIDKGTDTEMDVSGLVTSSEEIDGCVDIITSPIEELKEKVHTVTASTQDLVGNPVTKDWTFELRTQYTINLKAGWNLISLPIIPEDGAQVLADLVAVSGINLEEALWSYDAKTSEWSRYPAFGNLPTLTKIVDGKGYWVYMNAPATLTLQGRILQSGPIIPPSYAVQPNAWNLIGFKSITVKQPREYLTSLFNPNTEWASYPLLYGFEDGAYFSVGDGQMTVNGGDKPQMESAHGYWFYAKDGDTEIAP